MLFSCLVFCFDSGTYFGFLLDAFALDVQLEPDDGDDDGDGEGKADADAHGDAYLSVGGFGGCCCDCEVCR